jgi:hypothetical protein
MIRCGGTDTSLPAPAAREPFLRGVGPALRILERQDQREVNGETPE